jgi:flagellar M-ring protein FliF
MNFFQKISVVWQKIGLVQRALLIGLLLTFIAAGALLTYWARRPDMRMLYQEIAPEEASKITEKISEKGIEQGGYKIFDNEKIGISPFVQSVNLKRALQEELAKSIQMIDGVVHARIHIVTAEQTLFTSNAGKTTTSVVLRLRPGYKLSSLNIAAITHLVSGSVEGLTSENVTVIDSQGNLLSSESDSAIASGAGTVQDYRERVEQNLANKVEDMLTAVLGPGRATVRVSAIIDMNSVSTVTEKLEPKGVAVSEEITSGSETEASVPTAAGEPALPGGITKDEIIKTEYEIGKTVTQEVIYPGQIKSLKVAAFVDLSVADPNNAGSGNSTATIMQEADVVAIIQNALGLEDETAIKVVNVKFNRPLELLTEEEPSSWPRYIAIAGQASLGIMSICMLLVFRMFRGAKSKVAKASKAGELPEAEGEAGLLSEGKVAPEPLIVRRQIASALEQDPERVKQLFASWLEEKGG